MNENSNTSDQDHTSITSTINNFFKQTFHLSSGSSSSKETTTATSATSSLSSNLSSSPAHLIHNPNNSSSNLVARSPTTNNSSLMPHQLINNNNNSKLGTNQGTFVISNPVHHNNNPSIATTESTNSTSNVESLKEVVTEIDNLNSDIGQNLTINRDRDSTKRSSTSSTSTSSSNNNNNTNNNTLSATSNGVPNCAKVVCSYSAITEDEITVQKGDVVQIVTANMHNRFLVYREANESQPGAEGWIPGFVIGFQNNTNNN
jgi:hypothetical protein